MNVIYERIKAKDLPVNLNKIERMAISKEKNQSACSIRITTYEIRQVNQFIYLGTYLTRMIDVIKKFVEE